MIEKTDQKSESMREIFAPVREQIKESGVSDGELTGLLEEAREEVFQKTESKPKENNSFLIIGRKN
jgi:hypothetical protein